MFVLRGAEATVCHAGASKTQMLACISIWTIKSSAPVSECIIDIYQTVPSASRQLQTHFLNKLENVNTTGTHNNQSKKAATKIKNEQTNKP